MFCLGDQVEGDIVRVGRISAWMRVPGDTVFSVGALLMAWFVFRLWVAPKREPLLVLPIKPQTT